MIKYYNRPKKNEKDRNTECKNFQFIFVQIFA